MCKGVTRLLRVCEDRCSRRRWFWTSLWLTDALSFLIKTMMDAGFVGTVASRLGHVDMFNFFFIAHFSMPPCAFLRQRSSELE